LGVVKRSPYVESQAVLVPFLTTSGVACWAECIGFEGSKGLFQGYCLSQSQATDWRLGIRDAKKLFDIVASIEDTIDGAISYLDWTRIFSCTKRDSSMGCKCEEQ
jgi:hypothetical protein